jgi:hypothetical protein
MHLPDFRRINSPFGNGWRVICPECNYESPVVGWRRATAVAVEHRQKSAGTWRAAR